MIQYDANAIFKDAIAEVVKLSASVKIQRLSISINHWVPGNTFCWQLHLILAIEYTHKFLLYSDSSFIRHNKHQKEFHLLKLVLCTCLYITVVLDDGNPRREEWK